MSESAVPLLFDEAALRAVTEAAGMTPWELVELFLLDGDQTMEELTSALAANDASRLGRAAHSLKSSAGSSGAMKVADTARLLEMQARDGISETTVNLCETLATDFQEFKVFAENSKESLSQ